MGFIMSIKFAGISTIIFVFNASNYVSIRNFNKIGSKLFLELHP